MVKAKPGRKKTGRVRNETLSTKLTVKEKSDIVDTAKSEGKTQADYIVDIHKEHKANKELKMIKVTLMENGKKVKCQNCCGYEWMKPTKESASAYCAKCDSLLTFKVEK